jgi:hypothetical protein
MRRGLLLPALLLLSATATFGQQAEIWPPLIADPVAPLPWPESGARVREVLRNAIQSGDRERAALAARQLAAIGGSLTEASQALVAPLIAADLAAQLRPRFAANALPLAASSVETSIPADHHLIEGIAWDAAGNRLFVGSVVDRQLLVREGDRWRAVPLPAEVGGVFGMGIDPSRRLLWLTSNVVDQVPRPETAFRGLLALDLATLRVVRRLGLPADSQPGDLAIGPDGTVYASSRGEVYSARPGADHMEPLFGNSRMTSTQGIFVSADGARVYAADYDRGLGVYDIASRRLYRLRAPQPAMLDGIDGLAGYHGDLIAIQNGTRPNRIIRIRLAPGGLVIAGITVLERNHPAWGEPTLGAIAEGRLLYIANGQWDRYGAGGQVTGEGPTLPTPIRALPLAD